MDAYFPYNQETRLTTLEDFENFSKFINKMLTIDRDLFMEMVHKYKDVDYVKKNAPTTLLLYEKRKLYWRLRFATFNGPKK